MQQSLAAEGASLLILVPALQPGALTTTARAEFKPGWKEIRHEDKIQPSKERLAYEAVQVIMIHDRKYWQKVCCAVLTYRPVVSRKPSTTFTRSSEGVSSATSKYV